MGVCFSEYISACLVWAVVYVSALVIELVSVWHGVVVCVWYVRVWVCLHW